VNRRRDALLSPGTIIAVVIIAVMVPILIFAAFSGGSSDRDTEQTPTQSDAVVGSVETLDGHTYHCFRYTTIKRGGLWCTEATP